MRRADPSSVPCTLTVLGSTAPRQGSDGRGCRRGPFRWLPAWVVASKLRHGTHRDGHLCASSALRRSRTLRHRLVSGPIKKNVTISTTPRRAKRMLGVEDGGPPGTTAMSTITVGREGA